MKILEQGVTGLLQPWGGGDAAALDLLVPILNRSRAWLKRELGGR